MRRATVTIPDHLESELEHYLDSQDPAPSLAEILQTALARFLREQQLQARGYEPPKGPLRITPAPAGKGPSDVAAEHDHYLADAALEEAHEPAAAVEP
jgi:hypothetical protein